VAPEERHPDHAIVAPISLPADGRIPDPRTGSATSEEYDAYFRIARGPGGLVTWSQTCIEVQTKVLDDLEDSDLAPDERYDLLRGFHLVLCTTLHRWVRLAEDTAEDDTQGTTQ
jgi:hypothetical protein